MKVTNPQTPDGNPIVGLLRAIGLPAVCFGIYLVCREVLAVAAEVATIVQATG